MAILKMFSFDNTTSLAELGFTNNLGAAVSSVKSRTGSQSMRLTTTPWQGSIDLPSATSSKFWIQFAVLFDDVATQYFVCLTSVVVILVNDLTMALEVWTTDLNRNKVTKIASSPDGLVTLYAWNFLEVYIEPANAGGILWVKWNGVQVINLTGDTTGIATSVTGVNFAVAGGPSTYYDDVILGDGTGPDHIVPVGDARVEYVPPNAAGASAQFTPTSGANYTTVSEIGNPNDTTYNSSMDVGAMDLFGMQDLGGSGIVHAVQTVIRSRKDDAGSRTIRPVIRKDLDADGDTPRIYAGPTSPVIDSSAYTTHLMPLSPFTGVAWSIDEVNEAQFGYMIGGSEVFTVSAEIAAF